MNLARIQAWMDRPGVRQGAQVFLGILLVWAAVSKIANPTKFLGDILAYRLPFPRGWHSLVAAVLPWTELLCGLLLLAGSWLEAALGITMGLFGVFVVATGQAWMRGLQISCGCFDLKLLGFDSESRLAHFLESPGFALFRNLVLFALTAWLLSRVFRKSAPAGAVSSVGDRMTTRSNNPLDTPHPSSNRKNRPRNRR